MKYVFLNFCYYFFLLQSLLLSACAGINTPQFSSSVTGKTPKYHSQNDKLRHDLSGSATDGHNIITVDDGGKPSEYEFLRSMKLDFSENNGFRLSQHHLDLEGATYQKGFFVVTSSLSGTDDEMKGYYLTSRFKWDGENVSDELTVNLRDLMMAALKENFSAPWFKQISNAKPKKGGLNIEGLTVSGENSNVLIFGFRSPLAGDVLENPAFTQHTGKAILVKVSGAFEDSPSFQFMTVDLNGHGIRGMEFIPSLNGYLIVGGPTYKAYDYSLWFLPLYTDKAIRLKLPDFDQLCRPESVLPITENGKEYVIVFSEEAGKSCQNASFTYIKALLKVKD